MSWESDGCCAEAARLSDDAVTYAAGLEKLTSLSFAFAAGTSRKCIVHLYSIMIVHIADATLCSPVSLQDSLKIFKDYSSRHVLDALGLSASGTSRFLMVSGD